MTDAPSDTVRALVQFAESGARQTTTARRCWLLGHRWGCWETQAGGRAQTRECGGCGELRQRTVAKECLHVWATIGVTSIASKSKGQITGRWCELRCSNCGDLTARTLT